MKNVQKFGAFSAFYLALAYVIGIIIFLFVLDWPNIVEPSQKMELLQTHHLLLTVTNLMMYVLFGFFLIVLMLSLHNRFKERSPFLIQLAVVIGIVWAGLLIGSGMVANMGMATVLNLYQHDPTQATMLWLGIESVANGLGGANGEILGGVMTMLFSIAGIKSGFSPKGLNYVGLFVGAIGIISTIPGLNDLAGLFGICQILWFIWLGIFLLHKPKKV